MKNKDIIEIITKYSYSIDYNKLDLIVKYYNIILDYQEKFNINLTNITEKTDFIIKNILDTFLINDFLDEKTIYVADLGSGNGIPGIILAVINPDKYFYLIDSVKKKINFLNYVIKNLNLKNTFTLNGRLEEIPKNSKYYEFFDAVTARALAPLNQLIELSVPFIKKNGYLITTKSQNLNNEKKIAKDIISFCDFSEIVCKKYQIENNLRYILKYKKNKPANNIFPRKTGLYKKRPLNNLKII